MNLPTGNENHPSPLQVPSSELPTLAQVEREYIFQVLRAVDGNKTRAASVLGVSLKTVYNKLSRYGIK